ncbi:MAG: 50S ribosomal protein L22 [Parcubacteria group bacterium GW2011_GWC1_38_17]|uniref:Large ribosomal subunit protein uL22 n=1 Tax=Candidatus Azambacteria bacterium RIFCSPLOWO2_01_FULL_37_9 TaxID=1797297 RepID=A0A1F5C6F9_9BACT|nr:MAG: 50S ribosomal protein L22 [Parcubacteria group bacterium GW2011_GWC2_36_17]KKQ43572.1 MAG: 50S ribosomal protein L22 [Parcubacteria group bacterium GW2011_GWE2_37_8]KKQ58913.1 MAG: 50S ribosomal protein L22 [Parcubacteria group bacterium GW2011_GWC1_38_17]OGD38424.1 MAG: 50S ribosomal protein L22 [Candidatus Azambacteria bacterium RIFCSPLOWO2_01_FULL_37_9]
MAVSAKLNNLRISPRKVRLVADLIRGMNIIQAQKQLNFLSKRSAEPILKLLNSAVANAKNNVKMDSDKLIISEIFVDGGPVLKRSMPRAFGRAFAIRKRTSHITIILKEKEQKAGEKILETKKEKVKKTAKKINNS